MGVDSNYFNASFQICLYYIELEFNFSSDGLFAGSHAQTLSPQLKAEMDKYRDTQEAADDAESEWEDDWDDDTVQEEEDVPVKSLRNYSFATSKSCLKANSRLFSSHSAFCGTPQNLVQRRSIFTGFSGLVLQNPFHWIHVQSEFANLRKEWDPSFKKEDFITGTKHVGNSRC